jgi:hypothetical protein
MTPASRVGLKYATLSSFAALLIAHGAAAQDAEAEAEAEAAAADAQEAEAAAAEARAAAEAEAASAAEARAEATTGEESDPQTEATADAQRTIDIEIDTDSQTDALPEGSSVLYAIFTVADAEPLTIALGTTRARDKALAAWRAHTSPGIPLGKLVCQPADYNAPWSFYVDPTTVNFASGTVALCDARPSMVNANCASFGVGTYCPWGANLVELRECPDETTPVLDCPLVQ